MMRQRKYLKPISSFFIRDGEPLYPKDKDQNEMYPVVNNKETPIAQGYAYAYAKDASGKSKYPLDTNGNEIALSKIGVGGWHYAKDENGNALPKNKSERNSVGDYIRNKDGTVKFPLNREGDPAMIRINTQMTRDGKVIFPLDAYGNESYIKDDAIGASDVIYMDDVVLDRYAKKNTGEEIYPIQLSNQAPKRYREVILNEYAKTDLQEAKYPLDEYGNEYTIDSMEIAEMK
ncbi:hypothetical protein TNIN_373131 [Trichonephila inaurata madagascariensis]|uniref:Uncharacterized protein n=1 Tax=Trichonephila inaurata madagascariensis TaxID=2747483 RepID=A0A8X7CDU5_9ARAC|nr:hypothetical protein TNIN_373131 [Trichonephila inaurata madagascariensis]